MGKKNQIEVCKCCRCQNNISEKIELNDFDESWREGYILVYCDECASQIEVKLKR